MKREFRSIETKGRIVEITSRTIQGRYLLRPSPEANDLILGVLGRGQWMYRVELYAFIFLSNHFHLLMKAYSVLQMALFVGFVKGNIARELGVKHRWRDKFWATRYHHGPVDDDEASQIRRFHYLLRNGCKENLVDSPLDWPGVTSARALYSGQSALTGRWFDRTAQYRAGAQRDDAAYATEESVLLSPLPCLAELGAEEQQRFYVDSVRRVEQETADRHRVDGSRALGARLVSSVTPHGAPASFRPTPAPRFHTSTRERYLELIEARRQKQIAYRIAADRLLAGDRDVVFPEDCFPPRLPFVGRSSILEAPT